MSSEIEEMIMRALARHGALGASMLASRVEADEIEIAQAIERLKKAGRIEAVGGRNTKRYQIRGIEDKPV